MRIFNQLRRLQIEKQKIKNYAIYALGEIVLIVVGILIALQINNWNQGVNEARQRMDTLEILQQTFQANDIEIDHALTEFDRVLNITNTRIHHSGPEVGDLSDSLIRVVREIDFVNLSLVRGADVSAQDLSLISSEVRNLLLEYYAAHEVYKHSEQNVTSLTLKLRENHQQYVSLLTQGTYEEAFTIEDRNVFPSDYAGWLSDRDNQNLSVEIKWKARISVAGLKKLKGINEVILRTIWNKLYGTEGGQESAVVLSRF
ncbi:DUF6090 family protein [Neolewinella persica]|uniref:DUF6090 family protein n=1 Tax=Neolewinella persica TaxID=70998 RepID=UPI0003718242|nr:DUF6090 family protein [Neolewinella persica]